MSRRGRLTLAALVATALAAALLASRLAWVPDAEMAPSLLPGDLVLILPLTPRPGDTVAVVDPLDPSRWTLRRLETVGGAIRYEDGVSYTAEDDTPRVLEMARDTDIVVRKEGPHLVRLSPRPVRWSLDEIGVPDDAAFLTADARDEAVDSRWWGPVPLAAIQGVVVLRFGAPAHPWRGWFAGRAG